MSRRGTEEEQEQKRNGRRTAGKLVPKSALCENWKIGIGANFGTMPIFGINFGIGAKIGIGANFGTMPIFGINFGIGAKIGIGANFSIGANFGIGVVQVWHAGKLALVPILALDFGIDSNFCIGANFGIGFLAL